MIQDLDVKYSCAFKDIQPSLGDYFICVRGNEILYDGDGELPKYDDFYRNYNFYYLFTLGENQYFYIDAVLEEDDLFHYKSFHACREAKTKEKTFGIITAYQFASWHKNNRYCGCCGKKNQISHTERMYCCPDCKTSIYPKISPVIIVAIRDGERILLTKRFKDAPYSALIAGFCETGETVEETCRREVMEEVGIKIKNIKYYKSQPWSFSDSLLLGFYADLDGDDTLHIDYSENADAFWAYRKDLTLRNDDFSLTGELIDQFVKGNV